MVGKKHQDEANQSHPEKPKLVRRKMNQQSTFRMGRTIGERREHLETANERAAARKKDKKKKATRIIMTIIGFIILIVILILIFFVFHKKVDEDISTPQDASETPTISSPTIEIVDEDSPSGQITNRMREYIGQVEADLRGYNLIPTKAVIPSGAIREVDIYLENYPGRIKMLIDRNSAVSAEDTERMLRYLSGQGITNFEYIDVRIDGKAYWK